MVDNYEPIDLDYEKYPSEDEIEILLGSLKPGKELPPLANSLPLDNYANQLLAEIYLDKLLKDKILSFTVPSSVGKLKGNACLRFHDILRLHRVHQIMCKVITHHCLDLKFENCDNKGLLLHNCKPDDGLDRETLT